MRPVKIAAIIGARPQFIKAAAIARAFEKPAYKKHLSMVWIHTGQHYDFRLSKIFFNELCLPKPKYHLRVGSHSHGMQTSMMLERLEDVLTLEKPDLVMVFGDTNTSLAGAIAAAKLHMPLAHVEAGLRSFDRSMPEETNRIVADRLSELLFCSTKDAVRQLAKEGIKRGVYCVGDVMTDVLLQATKQKKIMFSESSYYLATIHRSGNTDDQKRLVAIVRALAELNKKVIWPMHPRTREAIRRNRSARKLLNRKSLIEVIKPLSYFQMIALESSAEGIITDSGGIQKEAFILGVPCVTVRDTTEWTETVLRGRNVLCEPDAHKILLGFRRMRGRWKINTPSLYGEGDAAEKILNRIMNHFDKKII